MKNLFIAGLLTLSSTIALADWTTANCVKSDDGGILTLTQENGAGTWTLPDGDVFDAARFSNKDLEESWSDEKHLLVITRDNSKGYPQEATATFTCPHGEHPMTCVLE